MVYDAPVNHFAMILLFVFFWPFLLMAGIETLIFRNVDWIHFKDIPFIVVGIIINVFYIYTIACFIVFLFKKMFRK